MQRRTVRGDCGKAQVEFGGATALYNHPVPVVVYILLRKLNEDAGHEERLYSMLDYFHTYCLQSQAARQWISPLIARLLTPLSVAVKSKDKTRGNATAPREADRAGPALQNEPAQKHLYHVDKASFVVFKTLFHTANDGEIAT